MTDPRSAMQAAVEALEQLDEAARLVQCGDMSVQSIDVDRRKARDALSLLRAALEAREEQRMLGEVWMAFGALDDGRLVALPEYAAMSEREVGSKVMDSARREGFRGLLAERLKALDWTIRRVVLAASPVAADTQGDAKTTERLIAAGAGLSNIAFNLSQCAGQPLEDRTAATMKECQREWDAALREFRAAMKEQPSDGVKDTQVRKLIGEAIALLDEACRLRDAGEMSAGDLERLAALWSDAAGVKGLDDAR